MRRFLYRIFRSFSALQHRARAAACTPAGQLAGRRAAAPPIIVGPEHAPHRRLPGLRRSSPPCCVVAALGALARRRACRCSRRLPRFATAGRAADLSASACAIPARARPPAWPCSRICADPRPSFEEFVTRRSPARRGATASTASVGYPRWAWLAVAESPGARRASSALPAVPTGGRGGSAPDADHRARRGRLALTGGSRGAPEPLGLDAGAAHRAVARHAADPAAALPAAAADAGRRPSLPARRHRAGVVRRRLGGVRRPARLPAGRSAQAHPLAELGAHRPAGGARVPGRVLRAPRPRARHVRRRARPRPSRRRCRSRPRSPARSAPRSRCSICSSSAPRRTASPRAAVSATSIGCSRSWPRCARAATSPSPRCRGSCWSTSVASQAPCCSSWPGTRRVGTWSIDSGARGAVPARVVLVHRRFRLRCPPARRAPRQVGRVAEELLGSDAIAALLGGSRWLFWGWQTGLLPVGLAMAVALEARMLTRSRWDLRRHDFNRVSDLSASCSWGWRSTRWSPTSGAGRDRHHPVAADGHVPGHRLPGLQCRRPRGDGDVLLVHAPASGRPGPRST